MSTKEEKPIAVTKEYVDRENRKTMAMIMMTVFGLSLLAVFNNYYMHGVVMMASAIGILELYRRLA